MSSCDALILVEVSKAYFEMVPRDYLNTPGSNFLPQQPTKEHFWGFQWLHIVTQGATVYPLYASSHCASRSYSLPQQQLGEEQDGGSRGSLETRITEWLAQTFQGQCRDESSLSWGVIALHNVQISAIIQAASWSLGMWWRRSLPRHIGLELLIYIVLYYSLQLLYRYEPSSLSLKVTLTLLLPITVLAGVSSTRTKEPNLEMLWNISMQTWLLLQGTWHSCLASMLKWVPFFLFCWNCYYWFLRLWLVGGGVSSELCHGPILWPCSWMDLFFLTRSLSTKDVAIHYKGFSWPWWPYFRLRQQQHSSTHSCAMWSLLMWSASVDWAQWFGTNFLQTTLLWRRSY